MEQKNISDQSVMSEFSHIAVLKHNTKHLHQTYPMYDVIPNDNTPWNIFIHEMLQKYTSCCIIPNKFEFLCNNALDIISKEFQIVNNQPLVIYSDIIIKNSLFEEYVFMPTSDIQRSIEKMISIPLFIYNCNIIRNLTSVTIQDIVNNILNIHIPQALFVGEI